MADLSARLPEHIREDTIVRNRVYDQLQIVAIDPEQERIWLRMRHASQVFSSKLPSFDADAFEFVERASPEEAATARQILRENPRYQAAHDCTPTRA